ncbi:hypothetical protein A203_13410 [Chromobacterium violaceum]
MLRGWHDVYARFGANTLKTLGAPSEPGVRLGEDDSFFVDIRPLWRQWEGDGGDRRRPAHLDLYRRRIGAGAENGIRRLIHKPPSVLDFIHTRYASSCCNSTASSSAASLHSASHSSA